MPSPSVKVDVGKSVAPSPSKKYLHALSADTILLPSGSNSADVDLGKKAPSAVDVVGHKVNLNSFAAPEILSLSEHDVEPDYDDHCCFQLVMLEHNPLRIVWAFLIFLLLVYTATVYLYRFTFCTFHIGATGLVTEACDYGYVWNAIDELVDAIFWIDLFANFLFSYKTERGIEIDSMHLIASKYLRGGFWINLIACIPVHVGEVVVMLLDNGNTESVDFRVARLTRLQRISRLTRLIRLTRLFKCASLFSSNSFLTWIKSLRGVRIVNFIVGLVFSVHLLGCFWYLCAALHSDPTQTWVARRIINDEGDSLMGAPPVEQWLHAMYFVLTIFTTVGFGDIAPRTECEILYVGFTMVAGTVVHSIIISEVIQAVTSTDRLQEVTEKRLSLIDAFCEHTQLPWECQTSLKTELKYRAKELVSQYTLDRDQLRHLIVGKEIPRWLLGSLPGRMFGGRLLRNQLFATNLYLPPRLPCLLAVHLHQTEFDAGEIVYQMHDFPFNLFLVLTGTFAHIGLPSDDGGVDMSLESLEDPGRMVSLQLKQKAVQARSPRTSVNAGATASERSNRTSVNAGKTTSVGAGKTVSLASAVTINRDSLMGQLLGGQVMGRQMSVMGRCKSTLSKEKSYSETLTLYPYRLCGHNTYFGEAEMMRGHPRLTTVRCESVTANTLVLHKKDFNELKEEFPQFGALWQYAARRRDWTRVKQRSRLVVGVSCRMLAVLQIQRTWRKLQSRKVSILASDNLRRMDLQFWTKRRMINRDAAKILDHKQEEEAKDSSSSQTQRQVEKLSSDVSKLRAELHQVLCHLGVRPFTVSI